MAWLGSVRAGVHAQWASSGPSLLNIIALNTAVNTCLTPDLAEFLDVQTYVLNSEIIMSLMAGPWHHLRLCESDKVTVNDGIGPSKS